MLLILFWRAIYFSSSKRCMILDPYFHHVDLEYAISIQNISIPVQIISSVAFLSQKIKVEKAKQTTVSEKLKRFFYCVLNKEIKNKRDSYAEMLQQSILNYKNSYALQEITCKVLRGSKSPLHDRYLVVDDKVYLLGSSLNEFGARATTIVKVPTPQPLIDQAIEWWNSDKVCPSLEKYLIERKEK